MRKVGTGKTLAMLGILLVAGSISLALPRVVENYGLAYEVQMYYSCLPYHLYWVRKSHGDPERGDLVQVAPPANDDRLGARFPLMKIVVAVEGDTLIIKDDRVYVNGQFWGALHLRKSLHAAPGDFDRHIAVGRGEIAVMGVTPASYDSRYWGLLSVADVQGKAYVLL